MSVFSWMRNAILSFFDLTDLQFDDIAISTAVIESSCELAKEVYPKEFVAVLKGRVSDRRLVIEEIIFQPFTNTTFSSSLRLDLPPLSGGVGSVHSHPSRNNRPSRQDLQLFAKMGGVHLIICNPFEAENIAAYLQDGTPVAFRAIRP